LTRAFRSGIADAGEFVEISFLSARRLILIDELQTVLIELLEEAFP
jgi:hypothetical protein